MTIGLMGTTEQVSITDARYVSPTAVKVSVTNMGASSAIIANATIDGKSVTFSGVNNLGAASNSIAKGTTSIFTLQQSTAFINIAQYTIKLQTTKGNTISYTYTYTGS